MPGYILYSRQQILKYQSCTLLAGHAYTWMLNGK